MDIAFSFWIISLSLEYKANIISVSCEITVTLLFLAAIDCRPSFVSPPIHSKPPFCGAGSIDSVPCGTT